MRLLVALLPLALLTSGLNNGLGRLPQMGYNSWYDMQCSPTDALLRQTADAMVTTGLFNLGYKYVNIDDCYIQGRDANGTLYPDPGAFPFGMKALADYIHSKGMLFGVYTDRGTKTCAGRPAAEGHEEQDARTYAEWGVDYLKEDSCNAPNVPDIAFAQYGKMRDSLNATGRPIFFSLCGWEAWYAPVGKTLGNSWRIGPDDTTWQGILVDVNINANLTQYAGPGGWNDPCLLLGSEMDNSLRTTELQSRAQFSLWAIMASPMLMSFNVRNMTAYTLETYANTEVIAVSQDVLGRQGWRVAGGDLGVAGGEQAAQLAQCTGDATQQFVWNTPMTEFLYNKETNTCLNVNACGTQIIMYPCVTTGGTCMGPNNYENEQFSIATDGTLHSAMNGNCLLLDGNGGLMVGRCNSGVAPTWKYNATSQQMVTNSNLCLQAGTMGSVNVWAHPLSDGGYAVLFINVGSAAADVTCNAACFSSIGIAPGTSLAVRDLWQHVDLPNITAGSYTASAVPPEGGIFMARFTPL